MRSVALPLLLMFAAIGLGCGETPPPAAPVLKSGEIGTWMGDGTQGFNGDDKDPLQTWLNQPMDLTFGPDGSAYIVDWNNHRIRRRDPGGQLQTFIGQNLPGDWDCQNPADPTNCTTPLTVAVNGADLALNHPMGITFSPDGQGYLAAWHNHKVEAFDPVTAMVHIVAGQQAPGYLGDGGPAGAARLNFVDSVVADSHGNVYVGDERNRRVRRIAPDATRTITDVVGTSGTPPSSGFAGDGGPATLAQLALAPYAKIDGADNPPPGGAVALGPDGTLYLSDTANDCIRQVSPGSDGVVGDGDASEEIITTLAGQCTSAGSSGDGGAATAALLNQPGDIQIGPDGKLYVADTGNDVIRRVDLTSGIIERVAGSGQHGFSGDFGPPLAARLSSPYGVAFDAAGNLYISDTTNNRIRIILK